MLQKIYTDNDRRLFLRRLLKLVRFVFIVCVVLFLTLFHVFLPLQTLLPAYDVRSREENEVRVHFLDVGEGDCSIVEFPDGALVVIDAGDGSFQNANRVLRYIKGLHYTSLSYVATHADLDHYGGFLELISYYGADFVYMPVLDGGGSNYKKFAELSKRVSCSVERLSRYGVIENESGAYFVCVSPYSLEDANENDGSTVLYFDYMGYRILFGADITSVRERRIMRDYALMEGIFDSQGHAVRLENIDLIKVSHHGSAYSSSDEWLALLSPDYAVVSCGRGNRYSHPSAEALFRLDAHGANIFRVDELGDVVVSITSSGLTINTDA